MDTVGMVRVADDEVVPRISANRPPAVANAPRSSLAELWPTSEWPIRDEARTTTVIALVLSVAEELF